MNDSPKLEVRHTNSKDMAKAGMRAFFAIASDWNVSNDEARALLGYPGRATFFNWKNGTVSKVPHDTLQRLSYILGIYKALQILYRRPDLADSWIRRPNGAFGGQSALERMTGGDVTDLAEVRNHLDAVRGGWG